MQVPPLPEEMLQPGIEVSGPAGLTSMLINALNPQPDGTQVGSSTLHMCYASSGVPNTRFQWIPAKAVQTFECLPR